MYTWLWKPEATGDQWESFYYDFKSQDFPLSLSVTSVVIFSWLLMHNEPLHKLVTKTLIVCRGHSSAGWQFGLNSSGESFVLPGLPEVSEVAWLCFGYRDGCSPLFPQKLGLSRDCSRCLREHRSKQNLRCHTVLCS